MDLRFSVLVFGIEIVRFPALAFRFLERAGPASVRVCRAPRAIILACSTVVIRRHSWVAFAPLSTLRYVSRKTFGLLNSLLPARPCSVISMKPSAAHSRIAGAIWPRLMPKWRKSSKVTGSSSRAVRTGRFADHLFSRTSQQMRVSCSGLSHAFASQ